MSNPLFISRTKAIAEAFNKSVEFDIKIAEDRLQYSSWLLVVAVAGLSISVTQTKAVLDASLLVPALSEVASKAALLAAVLAFIGSAASGAVVRVFTNKELESCRQRLTLIALQTIWVEAGESLPPRLGDVSDLIQSVCEAELLPEDKQAKFQEFKANGQRAERLYQRAHVSQQVLTAVGYALLLGIAML